jgi:hypothetical protein
LINSAGCSDFEKEATEIYCDNRAIYIDGFRVMKYFGFEGHKETTFDIGVVDKGQAIEVDMLADAIIHDREAPNGIVNAARAAVISYKVNESLKTGKPVSIKREEYTFA